jgi:CRISPR-associated protein Csx16
MSGPYENVQVFRLVTFLGTGNYSETVYRQAKREATRTAYVGRALAELFEPRDVAVLATEEAEQRHGDSLKEALRAGNHPAPRFVRIPAGRAPAELWQQFEAIKAEFRGSDGPVMLDITHGFRSQPFFAAAVATFVYAVDETPPNLRVCYAAYEAKNPNTGVAPIWELSEFVALLSWSQALAMFFKTGRADEAAKETQRLGEELAKAWAKGGRQGERPNLDALGKGLREFGADLETLRTGDLLLGRGTTQSSAARLLRVTQETKELAATHAPPLADILDRVAAMAEPITGAGYDLSGPEGRNSIAALAELYLRLGRYLEATAIVREGWVDLYAPKAALVPAASNFDGRERERAEKRANEHDPTFREVTDRRNDLLHAQYRPSAQKAADIAKTVESLVEKLRIASETPRGACFVNLTNHPGANWDEAQTKAALALAEHIKDIAFPAVSPDVDEKVIEALAEACISQIPPETSHALVQGEFTLTVELVRRLQARGVTCLAATSTRDVEEDAAGRRVSTFKFVRFRTYRAESRAGTSAA